MTIEAPLDEDLRVVRILSGQVKTHFWILGVLAVCVCVCVSSLYFPSLSFSGSTFPVFLCSLWCNDW